MKIFLTTETSSLRMRKSRNIEITGCPIKSGMTAILIIANIAITTTTFAAGAPKPTHLPGPYIGIQGGISIADEGSNALADYIAQFDPHRRNQGGLGGRVLLGWNFNQFFSIEGGYSYYADNTYRTPSYETRFKTYTWDIMGKIALPLRFITNKLNNWSLYGKFGAAYVTGSFNNVQTATGFTDQTNHAWQPTYSLGLVYNFNNNISADVSWTGFTGKDKIKVANNGDVLNANQVTPSGNLFAIGFAYKFTNLF